VQIRQPQFNAGRLIRLDESNSIQDVSHFICFIADSVWGDCGQTASVLASPKVQRALLGLILQDMDGPRVHGWRFPL
jgi:hypothetical protein